MLSDFAKLYFTSLPLLLTSLETFTTVLRGSSSSQGLLCLAEMSAKAQLSPNTRKRKLRYERPDVVASFHKRNCHLISPANSYQDPTGTESGTPPPRRPLDLSPRMKDLRNLSPHHYYAHIKSAGAEPQPQPELS